jgi:26S proteasome regulatory subunit T1
MSAGKDEADAVKIPVPSEEPEKKEDEKDSKKKDDLAIRPLDEDDIAVLKTYAAGPYSNSIKQLEDDLKALVGKVNTLKGVKESDTGLAPPSQWDIIADRQRMASEQTLQVARCTKIISPNTPEAKYMVNVKQIAKYVVGLADSVSPTDIEEGMRIGVERQNKLSIHLSLPPKIDPSVTMMTVEEKPDVTYNDVGGCKEQIQKIREVVEMPLLNPERFVTLGIDPPKGVLLYGPPGTGKTLLARAVANQTDACFIRVIGSELVQKYVGEGARMVRELFQMARTKKACIIFFDVVDAIGGARFDDGQGSDNEVQRTMLQIVTELDGFDARGNIKVLMATNRPDTLDPALLRPGRLDRKIEFELPKLDGATKILEIHSKTMSCEKGIRWELIARLCPNTTGAELRSVCTEAGMFAIRARRKAVTEKDMLDAVQKVIKGYAKFSSTPKYLVYN